VTWNHTYNLSVVCLYRDAQGRPGVPSWVWAVHHSLLLCLQSLDLVWFCSPLGPTISQLWPSIYGFSSSHVWMWELDHKESWMPKNWCFWTVVLEKTLESPLDCKEIKPVNLEYSLGGLMLKLKLPILWPLDSKSRLIRKDPDARKDWRQEKGMGEHKIVGWHHWLNGHEFEPAPGDAKGQGSLVCCSPWGLKE